MPCAFPRPAVPKVGRRRTNALCRKSFGQRRHERRPAECQLLWRSIEFYAKNRPILFPKRTMLTYPKRHAQNETRAQADAAEKTRSPRRTGNERAGLTAELPLPVLHRFQSRRRAGGRSTDENVATAGWERAPARVGHFSSVKPENRNRRPRTGLTPRLCRSARRIGALALWPCLRREQSRRRGRAGAPGLFVPCCACTGARRKGGTPGLSQAPGRTHEDLSAKLPA